MRRSLLAPMLAGFAAPALAQALVVLGENEGGRQILVDVTSHLVAERWGAADKVFADCERGVFLVLPTRKEMQAARA